MRAPAVMGQTPDTPRKPRPLWRNRDYMLLWSGQAVSTIGSQASLIAFPFLVLALTGSPAQAGFMGALRAVPYLLFSLPAGALIDRWNRKLVMILCDAGRALALGSIPVALLFGPISLTQLYIVSAVEGTLFVFFNLAEVACLPRVVPKEQLPAATAQNAVTDGTSALIGPSLGGALFGLGQMLPFVADAVSYAGSVVSLLFIRTRFQGERPVGTRRPLRQEIWEGLVWLWRQPLIRFIALLTGANNLLTAGYVLIIILLAQRLHASDATIGLILGIGGVGAILGAAVASPIQRRFRFRTVIVSTQVVSAALWPLLIFAPNVWLLGAITATSWVTGPIYNTTQMSYRLALIPDALQGRVNSVFRLLAFGVQPLGLALTGVLLERIQVINTVLVLFVGFVLMALASIINPHVRAAQPLTAVQSSEIQAS
ncbi:MAG: MFS transporter [Ktedonobacterales bacterium]|nr:MFS transporter [Ktedonobacterales bacterium]